MPVYTISDPRAAILKTKARELAIEKDRLEDLSFISLWNGSTPEVSECQGRKINKGLFV